MPNEEAIVREVATLNAQVLELHRRMLLHDQAKEASNRETTDHGNTLDKLAQLIELRSEEAARERTHMDELLNTVLTRLNTIEQAPAQLALVRLTSLQRWIIRFFAALGLFTLEELIRNWARRYW